MQSTLSFAFVASLCCALSAQQSIVIPNGYAAVEGSSSNAFPWGRTGIGLRHQSIYDSSHFTSQGVVGPVQITALKWRPNTNVALVPSSYTVGCTVQLSTCPVDQAAASGVFASNRGVDVTTVFSGPVSWGAQAAQAGPTPFGIVIQLQTPFLYDPAQGDLNIECDLPIQAFTGSGPQLDVESGAATALASRVYLSAGYPVGTGTVNTNHAVVVEVTFLPSGGYASASPYGVGCINQPDVSSYEVFGTASAFDLTNTSFSLLRTGTGYLAIPGLVSFVAPSASATSLALTDDSEATVTLSAPLAVGASGTTTQLTVCSNGFISSGPGNGTGYTPTAATFLNGAAAWWSLALHDFNPAAAGSGTVKFEEVGGIAYVTWQGVYDYNGTTAANANTMQAQFDLASGTVHYVYQTMSTLGNGFLVGYSDAGLSSDPGSMDISAALPSTYVASVFAIAPLTHAAGARPVLGTTIALNTSNVPPSAVLGLTLLGTTEFTTGVDLTFLGMPGCRAYTSLDASVAFAPAGGAGSQALPIPINPALAGVIVLSQGAAFAPGINTFGFVTSNGLRLTLDVQ